MSQPASIDESVPAATPAVSVTTQPTAVDSSASSSVTAAHVPAPASAPAPAPASSSSSKSLETRSQALSGDQITYLTLMAERHKLGTLDKAARVLVNYAQKDGDQRSDEQRIKAHVHMICSTDVSLIPHTLSRSLPARCSLLSRVQIHFQDVSLQKMRNQISKAVDSTRTLPAPVAVLTADALRVCDQ